jgi:transposase
VEAWFSFTSWTVIFMVRWQKAPVPRDQLVLFAECLEDRIPENHSVRLLDEILDGHDWSGWEAEYDGHLGQPAIHPSILSKTILYALLRGIRSSRQIEYAVTHNIDFIWLVSGRSIDHTTISKFRTAHAKQLRELYRSMCKHAIHMGVAKLAEVCIDGSRVMGNANRFKTITAEKADKLLEELDKQIATAMEELEQNDEINEAFGDDCGDELPPEVSDLKVRQAKLREVQEQLQETDAARRQDGIDPQKNPAQLSTTDPDARILPNKSGGYAPNYTPMAVTETQNGFIVGADVLVGNVEHVEAVAMVDRLKEDYGEQPDAALGDAAYSTGPNIADFEERSIELLSPLAAGDAGNDNPAIREEPTQPVPDDQLDELPLNKQTKRFDKQAFVYDEEKDVYYCPAGQELPYSYSEKVKTQGQTVKRRSYQSKACRGCPMASRCRPNPNAKNGRRVRRDEYEAHRERHRQKMRDPKVQERYKARLHYGETQFAFIKQWMNLRQFLLRGIDKVRQEWLWSCTAFNLKKLMGFWRTICAGNGENAAEIER